MNFSDPAELRHQQWADGPFPLIETPKHKEGNVEFTSARVADYNN